MPSPSEESFNDYKQAERKALDILAQMRTASPKKNDIELALLVAIFELHRREVAPEVVSAIIQGHLKTLVPYYASKAKAQPQGS